MGLLKLKHGYRLICGFLAVSVLLLNSEVFSEEPGVDIISASNTESHLLNASTVSAKSAILIEASTGTVIFSKNEKEQRSIASTTKIMTTLLTIEAGELDKKFTVDPLAIKVEGTSMGLLEGDIVTRRDLCYGMMLPSGNDAANAAAISVSGSLEAFAEKMNSRASSIGMKNTHFITPSGLDADNQYSSAYDLALLTAVALENKTFKEICQTTRISLEYGNPPYTRWLKNSNKLLLNYEDCIGVKTGFTDNARRCLVSSAQRNGVTLISVTLNASDDWADHEKMLDYGFTKVNCIKTEYNCSKVQIPVIGGEIPSVGVKVQNCVDLPLTKEQQERIKTIVYVEPFIYAGFTAGREVGKVQFTLDGKMLGESILVAANGCEKETQQLNFFEGIFQFLRQLFS